MKLFILSLVILGFTPAFADDCSGNWERFSSEPYKGTFFPDTNTTYWRFRFEVPTERKTILKVTGQYPYSRYLNFTIYDQKTLNGFGALPDRAIQPDQGHENPFLEGVDRDTPNRNYTVYLSHSDL